MTQFLDFHTHHPSRMGELVIQQGVQSRGIHPWEASETLLPMCAEDFHDIWAVGECGLDRCCDTPWDIQMAVFRHQVEWSERLHLPVIIHCVRAQEQILAVRRQMGARQPWIWHGFRGKPQQLQQLLGQGFYISFGFRYNVQSLHQCPLDRMVLETDDNPQPICILYQQVANELGIGVRELNISGPLGVWRRIFESRGL